MSKGYYDDNLTPAPKQPLREREWVITPPAQPYGELPGEEEIPSPGEGSSPVRAGGKRVKKASKGRPKRRKTGGKGRGIALLLAFLLFFGGCGTLFVYLQEGELPLKNPFFDQKDTPSVPDQEDNDWVATLPDTTAPRAPTGDGTTLTLIPLEGETLTAQEIYSRVNPSVVGVTATLKDKTSLGTGVIFSSDGYIVTNAHVISGGALLSVILADDSSHLALLVGYDAGTDLAVLKIEGEDFPAADFGDSAALRVGDAAYAIGNPLGDRLRGTMTSGIISAIDRPMDIEGQSVDLIQTNAALNPGNSGGALVNDRGQVVGITNMKMMSTFDTIEGLGFAIPTSLAKKVIDQIIEKGSYDGAPMLGVTVRNVGPLDGDSPAGAYVKSVQPGSDAQKQGVREGDVILMANGQVVQNIDDLLLAKEALAIGDSLELELWRDGETITVTITLMGANQF